MAMIMAYLISAIAENKVHAGSYLAERTNLYRKCEFFEREG